MKRTLFLAVMALLTVNVMANVRLSPLFGNGMVLQRNKPIKIWGWADRGEKVTVKFKKQTKTTITNTDGKWHLILNSEPEGGPYQLTIKGKDQLVFSDVLVGEVWVCSGQSNMEFAVRSANNASREIREANYSEIRQFKVPNTISKQPQDGLTGGNWRPATPENVGDFTAVGYFYAKELYKQLKVPIGLINST